MTKEDIIRMARESGGFLGELPRGDAWLFAEEEYLERFAALVVSAEREACAVIAETPVFGEADDITMEAKDRVAKAIRARGQA